MFFNMDTSNSSPVSQEEPAKRSPYDDLSREELVKKCKGLLVIAQKAKQAKQELQSELDTVSARSKQDADALNTLQELVDSLTEQKLTYITELDAIRGQQVALDTQLQQAKLQIKHCEQQVTTLTSQIADLDAEVVSLRGQNQQLKKENEELHGQLSWLETAAGDQQKQLQALEDTVDNDKQNVDGDLQKKVEHLNCYVTNLEKDLSTWTEKYSESEQRNKSLIEQLAEETKKYELEKEKKEKANTRLKSYREKLIKCSTSIKQLNNTKFVLMKTVSDYSHCIPKWQDEMVKLSAMLSDHYSKISFENREVKQQLLDYENKLDLLKTSLEDLQRENEKLKDELSISFDAKNHERGKVGDNDQLNLVIKGLESEKLTLFREKQTAKDNIAELDYHNHQLSADIKQMNSRIETFEANINFLECENTKLKSQLCDKDTKQSKLLKEQLQSLQEQFDALKLENTNILDLNNLFREEIETLKSSLERPAEDGENLSELNVSLQTDITRLETKLAAYKQENASLLVDVREMRATIKDMSASVAEADEIKAKMLGYKTENAELLSEMKEVNQVLKERGEAISKQEKVIAEMEHLIETLERDRTILDDSRAALEEELRLLREQETVAKVERDELKKIVEEKVVAAASLAEEIEKLKQSNAACEPVADDMSTSTISRAEEHARMRELDDSFEDKYSKLRIFAMKLKKKTTELTQQLQATQTEKSRLEALVKVQPGESEQVTIISEAAASEVSKKHVDDLSTSVAKTDDIARLEARVHQLSEDLEKERKTDWQAEIDKLKASLAAETSAHTATKENLERVKKDVKKKSVLSLEMEDYERSMRDLTAKMEENKKKMVQMESTVDAQHGTIASLRTQIRLLEEQAAEEEERSRQIRDELLQANEIVQEKENLVQIKNQLIAKLEQEAEEMRAAREEMAAETACALGEREVALRSLGQDKLELSSRLKRAETRADEAEDALRLARAERDDLLAEFASYKVRVAAVLRQNQTVDRSAEERLQEELAAARAQQKSLESQLQAVKSELEKAAGELSAERRRNAESAADCARAAQRTQRMHADIQRLTNQLESERAQAELQAAMLTQRYNSKIVELEARLERETSDLRRQLERAGASATSPAIFAASTVPPQYLPRPVRNDVELEPLNVAMLTREEGEGSEAAPSPPPKAAGRRSPVPLERLLEDGVPEESAAEDVSMGLTADQELYDLRRRLKAQIQRLEHVTLLLAESERECARHAQLSELLKSEVRRARGTQQAHNTQYVKNVTLKFLTLPPGDERSRLVPVLHQILTLSNDETHALHAIAKGQDPNARGWGSFLPWSGK